MLIVHNHELKGMEYHVMITIFIEKMAEGHSYGLISGRR